MTLGQQNMKGEDKKKKWRLNHDIERHETRGDEGETIKYFDWKRKKKVADLFT